MGVGLRLPIGLRQLRLPTVVANYRKFAQEAAQSRQPYEEYLFALLELKISQQDVNRRRWRVLEGCFPAIRTMEEFQTIPSLSQTKVLALACGNYLEHREDLNSQARITAFIRACSARLRWVYASDSSTRRATV